MSNKPEPYKHEAHEFRFRIGGKLYCTHCGLLNIRNEFTEWAIKVGCNHKEHSQYQNKRADLTKLGER